jgi:hypothetical protein
MTRSTIFISAALALAVTLPAMAAQAAQVNRTFVSAAGNDSNNCANVTSPCRHFAAAYAATLPSGEIFVLDPANYGSLTITGPVSIQGHGWASIAPPNGGNSITINANSGDNISIRGVSIDGTGATGGTNGIVFNSGGSLIVADCVVQNFTNVVGTITTGNGILIQPISGAVTFVITNTILSHNALMGISYAPQSGTATGNGIIDHVVSNNNQDGFFIETVFSSGQVAVAISNTIVSNNTSEGILLVGSSALAVSIDNTNVGGSGTGVDSASSTSTVTLGRSVITANGTGIANASSHFFSFQDNRISGNGTDIEGPLNSLALR